MGCFDTHESVEDDYILAIGDSATWAFTDIESRWTSHLERLSGRQVLNCGVSGTGPRFQGIKMVKTLERLGINPGSGDLATCSQRLQRRCLFPIHTVVGGQRVSTLVSLDIRTGETTRLTREQLTEKYLETRRQPRTIKQFLRHTFVSVELLARGVQRMRERLGRGSEGSPILRSLYQRQLLDVDPDEYPWIREAFNQHLDNIRTLQRLAEDRGIRFVALSSVSAGPGLRGEMYEFFRREVPYHFNPASSPRADAEGRRRRHHHDSHGNALGNRLTAEAIYELLAEADLI